jgi:tol-pal system protein YbgF
MKKNMNSTFILKNTQALIMALIFSVFTSTVYSRTLVFQSASEKSQTKELSQKQVAPTESLSTSSEVSHASVSSANSELFFMIEQLQQEVNSLRGLLEEQGHELRMLKQSSKDRYLDLDTRVLEVTKRINSSTVSSINQPPTIESALSAQDLSKTPVISSHTTPAKQNQVKKIIAAEAAGDISKEREPTKAETDDYQKAYSFIKNKQFDDSILALFEYTENYPDSPLLPNVYYWLGEVYLATSKFEQAKTSFLLVVSAYPNSQKVSDSLYKLAVTVDALGDKALARQYINDVQSRYPDSSAAKLARAYKINE